MIALRVCYRVLDRHPACNERKVSAVTCSSAQSRRVDHCDGRRTSPLRFQGLHTGASHNEYVRPFEAEVQATRLETFDDRQIVLRSSGPPIQFLTAFVAVFRVLPAALLDRPTTSTRSTGATPTQVIPLRVPGLAYHTMFDADLVWREIVSFNAKRVRHRLVQHRFCPT